MFQFLGIEEGVRSHGFVGGTQSACGKKSAGLEQYCCDSSHTTYEVGKRVRKSHNNQYQTMNAILIDPSTGRIWTRSMLQTSATLSLRTLELERVRASSAKKKRKQRHRQPPPEQQQKPRAQQQEPYQRVEGIETKQYHRQLFVPRTLARKQANCRYCCSRRVTRRNGARLCYPSVSSVSAWG